MCYERPWLHPRPPARRAAFTRGSILVPGQCSTEVPAVTIQIPLSQSGDPVAFAAALEAHRADLAAHRIGPANVPVPTDPYWIFDSLIQRVPAAGPVATRGPATFQVRAHEIVDDTPKPPPPPPLRT